MNLKRILDSRIADSVVKLFKILDAMYNRVYCKGTRKGSTREIPPYDVEESEEEMAKKYAMKQEIPTKEEARAYAEKTDMPRYITWLEGTNPSVKTPHYTASYYCPFCDCWHLTANDPTDLKEHVYERCNKARRLGYPMDEFPVEGGVYEEYEFPDYSDAEIAAYKRRVNQMRRGGYRRY